MTTLELLVVREFTASPQFRAEFETDPIAALRQRGLSLDAETITALREVVHRDGAEGEGRKAGNWWFTYRDATRSALTTS
jgi:hypothetical protein